MIPHPPGATTPDAPIVMPPKPSENDDVDVVGTPSSTSAETSTDDASVKLPEPHWDPVIGAATD